MLPGSVRVRPIVAGLLVASHSVLFPTVGSGIGNAVRSPLLAHIGTSQILRP